MYFYALITDLKSVLQYHLNFPRNRHIKLEIACWRLDFRRRQADSPKQKNLFIPKCYDIFRVLGRRKQHIVPNVP